MDASSSEPATVSGAYTPAMLAECVQVPVAAIRHWSRRGRLIADHTIAGEPCFGFEEAVAAHRLATLLNAGCSLRQIDQRVSRLERACTGADRPLSSPSVEVEGSDFVLRTDLGLVEPSGQRLMWTALESDSDNEPLRLKIEDCRSGGEESGQLDWDFVDEVESEALQFERAGRLQDAADLYRAALRQVREVLSGPSMAALNVSLAAVLFRAGDFGAARERYHSAIEADLHCLEAYVGLGSVLMEADEPESAVEAFRQALDLHPDHPDAQFHLAGALERLGRTEAAQIHWRLFTELAPESPWTVTARERLSLLSDDE